MGIIALGAQAFATVLFTQALSYAFPAHGAPDFNVENEVYLLYMLQPVFGIAMARIFLKERRKPYFWPLAACAIVGVYLIVFPQNPLAPFSAVEHDQLLAAVLILGAVILWASGTVFGRYSLSNVSFVTTAAMRFTLALPVLLILMLTDVGGGHLGAFSVHQIPSFIGIALIPGLLAMLLYYRALASTPASLASIAELGYPCTLFLVFSLAGAGRPRPAPLWDRDRRCAAADRGGHDAQPAQAPRRRRDAAACRHRPSPPKSGPSHSMPSFWIVVLIKDFTTAKSRLAPVLEPQPRRRLAEMTAARALDAALAVAPTLAVCGSIEAADLARSPRCRPRC